MTLGLVCDACDALSPINATVCQLCGASLGVAKAPQKNAPAEPFGSGPTAPSSAKVCPYCAAPIAPGHRFCGSCGKPVPTNLPPTAQPSATPAKPVKAGKTMFFGAMQAPAPKLILIKGE